MFGVAESFLPHLAGIIVVGVLAQWLAWRVALPSILLLLTFGLIAGPVTGWIDPDELFGPLLTPIVSISVALILYEGGLTLRIADLPKIGAVVRNLVSVGVLVTWVVGALAAYWILGLSASLSALLGAVVVVTGPTVIAPLLRHIRPSGDVGPALRWEGIVIDPVGAMLAVLVYEAIQAGGTRVAAFHVAMGVLKTVVFGGGLGLAAAALLVVFLQRYWIADFLQSAVSLMLVVATFTVSNAIQHESGLLAVTVMGFALANQKRADVEHIVEFKENLRVLLISTLFIVLAARLELADLTRWLAAGLGFVAVLVFVARPLSVFLSTLRSGLTLRQRVFLCWMAPRGIVAAAVASVFALRLEAEHYEGAGVLVPVTFITIIATVVVYGLTAPLAARWLGVAESNPQGVLFVGAHAWAREVASLLDREGFRVLLVDSNRDNISEARMAGLRTYSGSILAEHTLDELELGGIGRLFAVTPNDWVNALAVRRFARIFGRAECYQLPPEQDDRRKEQHRYLYGRSLFHEEVTYDELEFRIRMGYTAKASGLSEKFDYAAFCDRHGDSALPLFVVDERGRLRVVTAAEPAEPKAGETLISLVRDRG